GQFEHRDDLPDDVPHRLPAHVAIWKADSQPEAVITLTGMVDIQPANDHEPAEVIEKAGFCTGQFDWRVFHAEFKREARRRSKPELCGEVENRKLGTGLPSVGVHILSADFGITSGGPATATAQHQGVRQASPIRPTRGQRRKDHTWPVSPVFSPKGW